MQDWHNFLQKKDYKKLRHVIVNYTFPSIRQFGRHCSRDCIIHIVYISVTFF